MPDKVGYGAKNYLSVFENAVKASMLKPKDENELNELIKEQKQKFEENANKNIDKMLTIPKIVKEIKMVLKDKLTNGVMSNEDVVNIFAEFDMTTPDQILSVDVGNEILKRFTDFS